MLLRNSFGFKSNRSFVCVISKNIVGFVVLTLRTHKKIYFRTRSFLLND